MRYAIATGRAERDPCPDLRGALPPAQVKHMAAFIDPVKVGELLRAIDDYSGTHVVCCALKLAPLFFCRPGELRHAEWSDIDLDAGEWTYTASKTKTPHLVPLAKQAVVLLRDLHRLTGHGQYVFPGNRSHDRPMSNMAINRALQAMGYDTKAEITGHGFRAMARTMLAERLGEDEKHIEHQLAHKVPDSLGTAYNRTKFLDQRRLMMQTWADYLDKLKAGAEVIFINQAA
jgi:integrase